MIRKARGVSKTEAGNVSTEEVSEGGEELRDRERNDDADKFKGKLSKESKGLINRLRATITKKKKKSLRAI